MATVKGVWVFNDVLDFPESDLGKVSVSFVTPDYPDGNWVYIRARPGLLSYGNTSGGSHAAYNGVWLEDYYKKVDFGADEQTVSDDLFSWFTANAVQQEAETPTEITYNGVTTSLEAGQTATLACNGKKALTDVVVVFGADGSITYNGTETAVSAGQTATMACAGKKMLTDVVISV